MPKPTGPTSKSTMKTIAELRKSKDKTHSVIANKLAAPSRSRVEVNVGKLAKLRKYDTFAVPGKVLGAGEIDKPISVYALSFSREAKEKISKRGKALPLNALAKEKAKAKLVL